VKRPRWNTRAVATAPDQRAITRASLPRARTKPHLTAAAVSRGATTIALTGTTTIAMASAMTLAVAYYVFDALTLAMIGTTTVAMVSAMTDEVDSAVSRAIAVACMISAINYARSCTAEAVAGAA
jgi:hypothetical protein